MLSNIKNVGAHLRKRERKIIRKASECEAISHAEFGKMMIRAKRIRRKANDAIFMA